MGKEGEREGEKHCCVRETQLPLTRPQLGTWPANQACADWESNRRPFGLQVGAQSIELHRLGLIFSYPQRNKKIHFLQVLVLICIFSNHLWYGYSFRLLELYI